MLAKGSRAHSWLGGHHYTTSAISSSNGFGSSGPIYGLFLVGMTLLCCCCAYADDEQKKRKDEENREKEPLNNVVSQK